MGKKLPTDQLVIEDFAEALDVKLPTLRAYMARGQVPPPDGRLGDTPWWYRSTVEAHANTRPGRGRHRIDCTCVYCTRRRGREAEAAKETEVTT